MEWQPLEYLDLLNITDEDIHSAVKELSKMDIAVYENLGKTLLKVSALNMEVSGNTEGLAGRNLIFSYIQKKKEVS